MKKLTRLLGFAIALFASVARAEVVSIEYLDAQSIPSIKTASPYYINPQGKFIAAVSAGVGRKIQLDLKDSKGVLISSKSKSRVENTDTFVVNGVTYFGSKIDIETVADGQYTLESIIYNGPTEISRQVNVVYIDTKAPTITGDFFWEHFGTYAFKHTDGKFIVSHALGAEAGYPSIDAGASGFSHGTFTATYLSGPLTGTNYVKDKQLLLSQQGKLVIGTGVQNSIGTSYIPSNTAAQMRLSYTLYNKVGASSTRYEDVYVATRVLPTPPQPYGLFTGAPSQLDGIAAFAGFIAYTPGMAIPSNPVRMIYRADKRYYLGGGGDAEIYGAWFNGSRRANKVVHTDSQYIYFDLTGSTDGNNYSSMQLYVRDVSTWRTFTLSHNLSVSPSLAPPKSTGFSFFISGKNEWKNSNVPQTITKFDTNGINDQISKIKIEVEERGYDQRFSYDFSQYGNTYRGNCVIPAGQLECILNTALPYPGNDLSTYHNRHMISNIAGTLLSPEIVSDWRFDGDIAKLSPNSFSNNPSEKTLTFSFIDGFKDRLYGTSAIRTMDAYAVNSKGAKTKLTRTEFFSSSLSASEQLFKGTYNYSALPDGIYSFEAYVEDGFETPSLRNKNTHSLITDVIIDTSAPVITTNIKTQAIKNLQTIVINATDTSEVTLKSVILTGGKDNVNVALPIAKVASNTFRPEHIYIASSDSHLYTMTIKAVDSFGNEITHVATFYYVPVVIKLPDINQPAVASPLRSETGLPSNFIETPQVVDPLGELAQGNHDVYFTVLPSAASGMMINGELISPGETKLFVVNLSKTNHRLKFEAYSAVAGQELTNQFEINLPDVRVSLCPSDFLLNKGNCISVKFTAPILKCNSPYALHDSTCQMDISYSPTTQCISGYNLSGTSCKGTYTTSPLSSCRNGYSLVDDSTCEKIQTTAVKVCADGQSVEDGFCKSANNTVVPQKAYCDGKDISGGNFCEAGKCYTFKPDWNACQITVQEPSIQTCQIGTLTNGMCQVSDEYDLNMKCPFGYNRDALLCKRIEIIDPIKSCDDGYVLSGSTCSKTEVTPFISCPATHYLSEGRCHLIAPITINCPNGYSWNGSICKMDEQVPAEPVCETGQTFNGAKCQKDESMPAAIVCPADYIEENGKCSNRSTSGATPVCPSNYTWNNQGSTCEQVEQQPATEVCSSGFTWNGASCVKQQTQVATGQCSAEAIASGHTWNGSSCIKLEDQLASPNCTNGYSWNGTTCEIINSQPASTECPITYTWNGVSCVKPDTIQASPNCSAGYSWDGIQCAKAESQSATGSCSASSIVNGYSWNGASCVKPDTTAAAPICSAGYSWDGSTCAMPKSQPASPICPVGSTWNGSGCTETQPAQQSCNSGYTWNGNACIITESQAASPFCSTGFTWNGASCAKPLTQPATANCEAGYTWNGSLCAMTETQAASQTCPFGTTWNGSTCGRTETSPATNMLGCETFQSGTLQCGVGPFGEPIYAMTPITEKVGDQCITSDHANCEMWEHTSEPSLLYDCPEGWVLSGDKCKRYTSEVPIYTCPATGDWSLDGSACKRTITQTASFTCPASGGWVLSGTACNSTMTQAPLYTCPIKGGWSLSGSTCSRTSSAAPNYSCPATGGWSLSASTCSRTTSELATYTCPESGGWVLSGTTCNSTLTQVPSYTCPSTGGWTLLSSTCSRTLTEPTQYQCPVNGGWSLTGSSCNRTIIQSPTYTCPATGGWSLTGSSCNRTLTEAETFVCPAAGGWVKSGTTCNQTLQNQPTYTCPTDWELSSTSCKRTVTSPTEYTCPTEGDWTLSGSTCERTLTETPTYDCPVSGGWTLSSSICSRTLNVQPSSYVCEPGQVLDGQLCTTYTVKEPDSYTCPANWTLDVRLCRLTTEVEVPSYKCDPDWTLDGLTCRIVRTKPETRTCSVTQTKIDENTCFVNVPETSVGNCNDGWTPNATNCSMGISHPVHLSCNENYELIASQCHTTITEPVEVICQSGEELRDGKCIIIKNHAPKPVCDFPYLLESASSCKNEIVIPAFN